jgi:acyl transferase domain-containing protein/NAD(P)-dependent dehydrogenase (short-subunit alcohol dehydrogenase family)/acyl carrier protein/SAM-dependent methyltransferase
MNDNGIQGSPADQSGADALKKWLARELAQTVDISPEAIALDEPFSHFGLDSAKAVGLLSRLSEFLGRKIPVTLAWNYPTIEALANYLCGNLQPTSKEHASNWSPVSNWNQPIAVIGMGCRFPGADDPEAFWESLRSGRSSFREISHDRWKIDDWYHPDPNRAGKMNARMAGLLERIDRFDPGFFAISPREASQIDPQQRLALELTWEALEDAGVNPDSLRGSRTGVFVGVVWHDYETVARKAGAEITAHSGTGQAFSIVANRISYALGLQGPSMALDTACSSSLVGVHLACRSLQAGDASLAIAGGVNMIIDPETMVTLSKFGGLSPTSQLCAFDARANGFVRGEGGGFVVLKPLNRALADGDHVYAIIRGSAVNNDGASNGLTAPNPQAQESVLEEAYARAGIEAAGVHYVEAHGTGTALGDPIEAQALGNVLGCKRATDRPLLIGSVKTNIGHLEGAAGIAGLIKLVLSIHHRQIPPSLNFETPNPHIDFTATNLRVVTAAEPWPEPNKPAVGGVSAFGWGGTNCHVVIEEAARSSAQLLPLSAPDPNSLKAIAKQVRAQLNPNSLGFTLQDICASAATRYSAGPERVGLTARSLNELNAQLEGFLLGQKRPGIAVGHVSANRPKLAFVFSPQGSQWLGMGRSLIAVEPVFRAKLIECEHALTKLAGWSLFNELLARSADSRLNRVEFVQPTLFAMQLALAALWESWGVRPDFVTAHSLGEWAAACVAGALSVGDAMRVVVESSRAQAQVSTTGGMAIVELAEPEVRDRIRQWPDEVFFAGNNSPTSTIISGDVSRVKSLVTMWKEEGLLCSLIDVDVAAHCPAIDPAQEKLRASLMGLHPARTTVPFLSSVSGDYLCGTEMGPEHWAHHLRQPVLFTQVIERLARNGCTLFLEISPHPLLGGAIQQILSNCGIEGLALCSCRRSDDERASLLNAVGALHTYGWPVDWPAVIGGGHNDRLLADSEPFQEATPLTTSTADKPLLLPLSGHTIAALKDRARAAAHHIEAKRDVAIHDIAYTAAARRKHLEHRLAVVAAQPEDFVSALLGFANSENSLDVVTGRARSGSAPEVAFVCSGQGPQWWGMGRELLASAPVFRREVVRCASEMKRHVSWDLYQELTRDEASSRLNQTEIAQPALFALQLAIAALWGSWGIEPRALIGHSVGEVAAAHLGGILSFEDAVMVVCRRGRLMQRATGLGRMAALALAEAETEQLCAPYFGRVSIAAVNSQRATVISGDTAAIDEIVALAKDRDIRSKILPVDYAFHSVQMEPFRGEMVQAVSGLTTRAASIPVYSTVTGALAAAGAFDASYWGRNICQSVRFSAAIQAVLDTGVRSFVELSPHPVLSSMILECAEATSRAAEPLPSLRRGVPEQLQMLRSLAALFTAGGPVNWAGVYVESGRVSRFPTYPWQRQRCWFEPSVGTGIFATASQTRRHGRRLYSPGIPGFIFETRFEAESVGFLQDHRVFDAVIVPAPMMIEMVLSASTEAFASSSEIVRDLVLHRPLILTEKGRRIVHLVLDPVSDSLAEFKIHSSDFAEGHEPVWTLHATGKLLHGVSRDPDSQVADQLETTWSQNRFSALSGSDFYSLFKKRGVDFGPAFRVVERVVLGESEALASLTLPEQLSSELSNYRIHPVLLDGVLQTIAINHLERTADKNPDDVLWLLCGFDELRVVRPGAARLTCHAISDAVGTNPDGMIRGSAQLYDENGLLVAVIAGARFQQAPRELVLGSGQLSGADLLFEVVWKPWSCPSHGLKRQAIDYLPPVQPIAERLRLDLVGRETPVAADAEIVPALDRLSAQYVTRAFRELGWIPRAGEPFVREDLIRNLGITEPHKRLVIRMLGILDEEGAIQSAKEGWVIVTPWPQDYSSQTVRDLRNRFPDYHAELDLFDRCASRLSEVLQGRCNPLELLFPEGSLESAGDVYHDSPMSRRPNGLIRTLLKAVVEALPPGRVLRVLEIGAGTGGTTSHLLTLLQETPCEYVFSDISKLFLHDARRKFRRFPFVRYALFDVEHRPETQGFAPQQFDVIVAANVLHATRDLRQALSHVQRMLCPGGILALLEGFRTARWIDLVFGQTEGWWRFTDTDLRPSHPLLPLENWKQILGEAGFCDANAIPTQTENGSSVFDQAVIIAKASTDSSRQTEGAAQPDVSGDSLVQPEQGGWIVFGNSEPVCDALIRLLTMRGAEILRIDLGPEFERLGERYYRVDASRPDQVKQAIAEGLAKAALTCRHAICLWGITSPQEPEEIETLYDQGIALSTRTLHAAQSLASNPQTQHIRLWLATCGAQPPRVTESPMVSAAPVWGLGRVLAVEQPEIWGGLLDLDPAASSDESAEAVFAQVTKSEGEDQSTFREGVRFVPRLVRPTELSVADSPLACSAEGCYLITGGLGGIGLHLAQWLVRRGARKLVLLGRTPLPPRSEWEMIERDTRAFQQTAVIREMESNGAVVRTVAMDIANKLEIERLFESLQAEEWLPIYGVVHTAAVADDRILSKLDAQSFQIVFRPKVLGALALEKFLADQPLQFFICCSSVGALLGQTGQANYAAANAFLDAFVRRRRTRQQPATGVNWGGWYGAGLAVTAGGQRTIMSLEQRGILGFEPSDGVAALELLMRRGSSQATVIGMDWAKFRQTYPEGEEPSFLASLATTIPAPAALPTQKAPARVPKIGLREQLLALESGAERRAMLEAQLKSLLATVLKLDISTIDVEKPMGALGLDSLLGFELKNRCEQSLGLPLSATMVWNYPTVAALTGHLADKLGVTLSEVSPVGRTVDGNLAKPASEQRVAAVINSVEQLSEDEALIALLRGGRQ